MARTAVLPLDFIWSAPESCPTQAEVVQQLSKAVDAGEKELPPLVARATVTQEDATWRLVLTTEMDGRRGTRLLEADSCEGLSRAATLVLALTFGEGLARRQAEAEARAAEPAPPPPPPEPPPPEPPRPASPPRRDPRFQLWAGSAGGTDPLGGLGPAVTAGFAMTPGWLRLGLRLEATFPRSTPLSGVDAGVQSYSFGGGVQACAAPSWASAVVWGCADVGATLLLAHGEGTARDREATIPLYGAGPAIGGAWLFHRHAFLELGLTSRFFFARPELVVEGLTERRRVEAFNLSGELGAGVHW